jgi:hypothetical protein
VSWSSYLRELSFLLNTTFLFFHFPVKTIVEFLWDRQLDRVISWVTQRSWQRLPPILWLRYPEHYNETTKNCRESMWIDMQGGIKKESSYTKTIEVLLRHTTTYQLQQWLSARTSRNAVTLKWLPIVFVNIDFNIISDYAPCRFRS